MRKRRDEMKGDDEKESVKGGEREREEMGVEKGGVSGRGGGRDSQREMTWK